MATPAPPQPIASRPVRPPSRRAIVTRPRRQALPWVERLGAAGIDAVALPLIAIAPPPQPEAVAAAWQSLRRHRLVVFVSPTAAEAFFAQAPAHARWPEGLLAASTGPGRRRRSSPAESRRRRSSLPPPMRLSSTARHSGTGSTSWTGAALRC
jgi:uroporphyrinogen-III synthase